MSGSPQKPGEAFNKSLAPEERKAILKDFPKPSCSALEVPKLDDQIRDHLKGKGKDPHFGTSPGCGGHTHMLVGQPLWTGVP